MLKINKDQDGHKVFCYPERLWPRGRKSYYFECDHKDHGLNIVTTYKKDAVQMWNNEVKGGYIMFDFLASQGELKCQKK